MKGEDFLTARRLYLRVLVLLAAVSIVACQSARDAASQARDLAAATLKEVGARVITKEERIRMQVEELGATTITVSSVKSPLGQSSGDVVVSETRYGLQRSDYARIIDTVPTISEAVPLRFAMTQVRNGQRIAEIRLVGSSSSLFHFSRLTIKRGRALTDADGRTRKNVAVVSDAVVRELFPDQNPIGAEILVNHVPFAVVGCVAERDSVSAAVRRISGLDDDSRDVYVPITAFDLAAKDRAPPKRDAHGRREIAELDRILCTVQDVSSVEKSAEIIDSLLGRYHKQRDYSLVVPLEWLREGEQLDARERRKIAGVDLSGLSVTDSTLTAVKDLADLEMLLLDDTTVSDQGLKQLTWLRRLRVLSLRNTNVTDAGVGDLQTALPNCAIRH